MATWEAVGVGVLIALVAFYAMAAGFLVLGAARDFRKDRDDGGAG